MKTWVRADFDGIITDFMGQLRSATEQGWQHTRPDHYRAILAALASALQARSRIVSAPERPRTSPPRRARVARGFFLPNVAFGFRWSWRPLLCLIPVRGH